MAEEGREQDIRTKEIKTLIINLRLLALKFSHETEKLSKRTKLEAQAKKKNTFCGSEKRMLVEPLKQQWVNYGPPVIVQAAS